MCENVCGGVWKRRGRRAEREREMEADPNRDEQGSGT